MTKQGWERILVVEDDASLRELILEECGEAGYQVQGASTVAQAWEVLPTWQPDLVLSDLRLPGADGMSLLQVLPQLDWPPAFIIITAFGTVAQAVDALKQGADDFLTKPLDLDHLLLCVRRSLEYRRLRLDVQRFRECLGSSDFHGLLGRSAAMTSLFATLRQLARVNTGAVLVTGESGTGKDLVARAIHEESPRQGGPFVAVNCAGIPAELLESEFFGHAAGAFTGAQQGRKGLFAEAQGGTLFLDEIADMPWDLQVKLLRVLEDGSIRPVGANREKQVDVRIVAATNADLEQQVAAGRFRQDLYYRLETFALTVPPLRERGDDLDLLAARFIHLFSGQQGRSVRGISQRALDQLHRYPFAGNVRELRNALERAVAFCQGQEIELEDLPVRIRQYQQPQPPATEQFCSGLTAQDSSLPSLETLANRYVAYVLERFNGNKRQAAQVLDISRATLYRRLGETGSAGEGSGG